MIKHPAGPSIVLPIIDDSPPYMRRIMIFAPEERRCVIPAEIETLRPPREPGASRAEIRVVAAPDISER